jgi:phytoene dehydrogenase-like protein
MEEFDAIVIGAGHHGLIAATVLAESGLSTVVVEAGPQIGGAVQSAEMTEPGFVHDLFATNMNLFLGSPFYARYSDELAANGLRFARSSHPFASVFRNGVSIRVMSDEEATLEMWRQHSAEDAAGWERLRDVFEGAAAAYLPLYSSPQPSWTALMTSLGSMRTSRRNVPLDELAAPFLSTTRALGDRYFATPEAKATASAWGMHLAYGPDAAGGALFPLLEMYGDMLNGMSLVEGGAGRLPQAIADLLRCRGGTVMTRARVARIGVDTTGATGVTLTDGRRLRARRGIISTTMLPHLVRDLLAHTVVPVDLRSAVDAHRISTVGTFMLHLALAGPIPWRDERLSRFAYVHVGGSVDDMARTCQQALAHQLPDAPMLIVGQTSTVDPTRVPAAGQHIVRVMTRMVPQRISADSAGRISGTRWSDIRDGFADRVMDILETYAPGLKDLVTARAAASPDDLQHTNNNLIGGDSGAGSDHLDQLLIPSRAPSQYHTSIPRLYVAGVSTWPGVGVNGISGQLAAETLLRGRSAAEAGTPD